MGIDFYKDTIRILLHEGANPKDIAFQFDIDGKEIEDFIIELDRQKAEELARLELENKLAESKPKVEPEPRVEVEPEHEVEIEPEPKEKEELEPKPQKTQGPKAKKERPEVKPTRMDKIRNNYAKLTQKTTVTKKYKKDDSYVENRIEAIEKVEEEIVKATTYKEKKRLFLILSRLISDLKEYELSLEQCDRLDEVQKRESIADIEEHPGKYSLDKNTIVKPVRIASERRMAMIETMLGKTDDVSELYALEKELSKVRNKGIVYSALSGKISRKIQKLNYSSAVNNIKYNITPETDGIIRKLLDGSATREDYEEYIKAEAKKKSEKTFGYARTMDEDVAKRSSESSLFMILRERTDKYPIVNPDTFIQTISKCKDVGDYDECARTRSLSSLFQLVNLTLTNLMNQGRFEEARAFCESYKRRGPLKDHELPFYKDIKRTLTSINLGELGTMVRKKIEFKESSTDDDLFITKLEKRIEESEVSLSSIPIVKQSTVQRGISLADIWYTAPNKLRHR